MSRFNWNCTSDQEEFIASLTNRELLEFIKMVPSGTGDDENLVDDLVYRASRYEEGIEEDWMKGKYNLPHFYFTCEEIFNKYEALDEA